MTYATQENMQSPTPYYSNFEEALKVYQGEVAKIQEDKTRLLKEQARIESEISTLLSTRGKLTADCESLKKNSETLSAQIKKEILQVEKEIEDKRAVLAADLDARQKQLAEFQATVDKAQSRLRSEESAFEAKINDLKDREDQIVEKEAKVAEMIAAAEQLLAENRKKDADLKLVSEQLAAEVERQKLRGDELKKNEAAFAISSEDLLDRLAKVETKEAEIEAFKKTKEDFEVARDKFAADKADFEAARDRLAVREMAVAEAESQNRNWENDLNQREKLLVHKIKE